MWYSIIHSRRKRRYVLDVKKKELPTAFHRRSLTYVLLITIQYFYSLFFHPNSQDFLRIQTTT